MKVYVLMILLFLCSTVVGIAQEKLKTKRVTVFKDATAFVEKEGVFDVKENRLEIELPFLEKKPKQVNYHRPNQYVANEIILGTLDVSAADNKIISKKSVNSSKADKPVESLSQLLLQNKGKRIRIKLRDNGGEVSGEIYSIDRLKTSLYNSGNLSEQTLLLKDDEQWRFVSLSEIREFEFIDKPMLFAKTEKKNLILQFEKNRDNQKIDFSYLRKGIIWTPNYHINLKSRNKFELSLKATIVNDVEELVNVDLNLAVGIPVFKYSTIGDPLFSTDRVIDFVKKINNSEEAPGSILTNSMLSQSSTVVREISYGNSIFPTLENDTDDDIYTYGLQNVSLNKGERVNLDITTLKGEYDDIYMVGLRPNDYFVSNSYSHRNKDDEESNDVWHAIKFANKSELPLTTGTVLFKKQLENNLTKPISQGRLNYTPDGEDCFVKMSVAPNVVVNDSDKELSRERDKTKSFGYLVKVQGEIEITNFKEEALELLIDRRIRGINLIDASEDWKVLQTSRDLFENNQTHMVRWSLNMKPKETRIITYTYEVYVKN